MLKLYCRYVIIPIAVHFRTAWCTHTFATTECLAKRQRKSFLFPFRLFLSTFFILPLIRWNCRPWRKEFRRINLCCLAFLYQFPRPALALGRKKSFAEGTQPILFWLPHSEHVGLSGAQTWEYASSLLVYLHAAWALRTPKDSLMYDIRGEILDEGKIHTRRERYNSR